MPGETGSEIRALLGPTNTGKTHRAVERLLEHESGMIGLPLRLLAREVYDRVTSRVGEQAAALVTGEEKRVPHRPRYWICTTEAMPVSREVDFVAVDEVQLVNHPQRGHVFTDRLLNGAWPPRDVVSGGGHDAPVDGEAGADGDDHPAPATLQAQERGQPRPGRAAPRCAVIAFSAAEVVHLADRIRRRRGGAAVVMGALSRARATRRSRCIRRERSISWWQPTRWGWASTWMSITSRSPRCESSTAPACAAHAAELGQIAGRAGRYTTDGTFGAVTPLTIPDDLGFAVESHRSHRFGKRCGATPI